MPSKQGEFPKRERTRNEDVRVTQGFDGDSEILSGCYVCRCKMNGVKKDVWKFFRIFVFHCSNISEGKM